MVNASGEAHLNISETLKMFHIYLSAFCGFSPQANGSEHILPIPYQDLGEDCCILEI